MAHRRIAYAALLGLAVLFQIFFRFYLSTFTLVLVVLLPVPPVVDAAVTAVIVLTTVYSGVEYFVKNKDVIDWSKV